MAYRPDSSHVPKGVDVTWSHDGMTVRQPRNTRFSWLVVAFLASVVVLQWATGWLWDAPLETGLAAMLGGVYGFLALTMVPRQVEVQGDWLTLDGLGRTRLRLDEIESIQANKGHRRLVFQLRDGRRHSLWLRRAFGDEGRRWLHRVLNEAVRSARAKDTQREALDERSRRALAALQRGANTER